MDTLFIFLLGTIAVESVTNINEFSEIRRTGRILTNSAKNSNIPNPDISFAGLTNEFPSNQNSEIHVVNTEVNLNQEKSIDTKFNSSNSHQSEKEIVDQLEPQQTPESSQLITMESENKRNSAIVKRTIYPGSDQEYGGWNGPFCYDRYVTGNCRYRTDPEYCYQYEWTAYAIVENLGGEFESDPIGLLIKPWNQGRLRVWIKTSCCNSIVKIIGFDPYSGNVNTCLVDVRELQGLHPAEIAGIVLGVLFILIIIIVAVFFIIRKRNSGVATVDNDCQVKSYGFNTRHPATSQSQTARTK